MKTKLGKQKKYNIKIKNTKKKLSHNTIDNYFMKINPKFNIDIISKSF